MKIFWITPEMPYPPNTGGRVGIWKRLQYLSRHNEIYLYSIFDSDEELQYISAIKAVCVDAHTYKRVKSLETIFKCIMFPYPAVSRWNPSLKSKLETDYSNIHPDCVVIDFPQMIGVMPESIMKSGKIVLNQHNIEFKSLRSLQSKMRSPIKRLVYFIVSKQMECYEREIYKGKSIWLYTFVSETDKEFFETRYQLFNTILIPVGAEIIDQGVSDNCHKFLFVGKMSYPANEAAALWLINEIFPRVKKKVPDAELYLVGKEPQENIYRATEGNTDIHVTGTVDSVEEYYQLCNLAVVPIMSGGGVNVKLLEALGFGKYVVTTKKGIEGTLLKDGKHVFVSDDADLFAGHCIEVMLNPTSEKNLRIRENAKMLMERNYSWEAIVDIYDEALHRFGN